MRNLCPGTSASLVRQIFAPLLVLLFMGAEPKPDDPLLNRPKITLKAEMTLAEALGEFNRQFGIEVRKPKQLPAEKFHAVLTDATFWEALEHVATHFGLEIAVSRRGTLLELVPKTKSPTASRDGPFRIIPREVRIQHDLSSGQRNYTLTLELHWEPKFPVFRVSDSPVIRKGSDDLGKAVTTAPLETRSPVSGFSILSTFPLTGLSRKSQAISELEGTFTVTAAEKMLTFVSADLGKPKALIQEGIQASLSVRKEGAFRIVTAKVQYPQGFPVFESFEESLWQKNNTMTLISPTGMKFTTTNVESIGVERGANTVYRFSEATLGIDGSNTLAGWKVEYTTPSMLKEFPIRFSLKGIDLP